MARWPQALAVCGAGSRSGIPSLSGWLRVVCFLMSSACGLFAYPRSARIPNAKPSPMTASVPGPARTTPRAGTPEPPVNVCSSGCVGPGQAPETRRASLLNRGSTGLRTRTLAPRTEQSRTSSSRKGTPRAALSDNGDLLSRGPIGQRSPWPHRVDTSNAQVHN